MTLRELLEQAVRNYAGHVALRFKVGGEWRSRNFSELLARVRCTADFIGGLELEPGERVALLLPNCPEWAEIFFGITCLRLVAVPMDAKLREQEIEFILRDSGARVLFCGPALLPLLPWLRARLPALRTVVAVGTENLSSAEFLSYQQAVAATPALGAYERSHPQTDDLAALLYTSGTTSEPKGAELTHGNFTSNVAATRQTIVIRDTDDFLLVLPLHHALPLTANLLVPVASGSAITFIESIRSFGDDMRTAQPTVLIGVPLLFEKMYRRVQEKLQASLLGRLLLKLGLLGLVRRRVWWHVFWGWHAPPSP